MPSKDDPHFELLVRIDENVKFLKENHTDQEGRIRSLEKHRHWTMGFAAGVSALVSYFMGSK